MSNMITISWDGDGIRISGLGQLLGRPTNLGAAPVAPTVEADPLVDPLAELEEAKPAPKKRGRPKAEPAPEPVAEDDDPFGRTRRGQARQGRKAEGNKDHIGRDFANGGGDLASPET